MNQPFQCPRCGSVLEDDTWAHEVCPRCLLQTAAEGSAETIPDRIGPYRILEQIGEGGMGVVYRAEQSEPVRRTVALKVIKRGLDSSQVIARFDVERQALALMDHPSIARVFDAGETEDGRPYFVMEFVRGVPVTEHCDRERLPTVERLKLFTRVCEAVQHAHQKAVIHRDLKPSNILVTIQDERAIPKIIDFGIAKAVAQKLTERTLFTEIGVLVGTPEYMSPEQAEMTGQDVDTRSDVYSLGVLLYELLTGALPFESHELRRAGFDEIRRRIREQEPPKPSTRVESLGAASQISARNRHTDPRHLVSELRGDLDWIVMRALEKDRRRRYGSPSEFAADLRRHLAHEPVVAGPPSVTYRIGKFVRRHRLAVTGATIVVAALIVGIGMASWGLLRAKRSEERALVEAATAQQSLRFLTRIFGATDPWNEQGEPKSARDLLEAGADRIDAELSGQPLVRATLMAVIGQALQHQWENDRAESLYRKALAIREDVQGPDNPRTIEVLRKLANLLDRTGRWDESVAVSRVAVERARGALGEGHPATLQAVHLLALTLERQGHLEEALAMLENNLDVARRAVGEQHLLTMAIQLNVGGMYDSLGRYDEAEALKMEAVETRSEHHGADHPLTVTATMNLAETLLSARRLDEALELLEPAVEARLRLQGEDHPMTLVTRALLGRTYRELGRLDDAERVLSDVLRRRLRQLGPIHPETLRTYKALGLVYLRKDRPEAIERLYGEALGSLPADAMQPRERLSRELEEFHERQE